MSGDEGHGLPVVPATLDDVEPWLRLVAEVAPLFGPMPDFAVHLDRQIRRGTAWCVRTNGAVLGGVLVSRARRRIGWLAVTTTERGAGLGSALLTRSLEALGAGDVDVVTFGLGHPGAEPARHLYEARGFVAAGPLPDGPEGGPRQRFVRSGGRSATGVGSSPA